MITLANLQYDYDFKSLFSVQEALRAGQHTQRGSDNQRWHKDFACEQQRDSDVLQCYAHSSLALSNIVLLSFKAESHFRHHRDLQEIKRGDPAIN